MRGEFVELGGARVYCFAAGERGAGEPIVLVHGAFNSAHVFRDLLSRLPKGHRVLATDLLGFGRSDRPDNRAVHPAAHAERLIQLLDALGVEPACLVGHGIGGAVVTATALAAPERVSHLMLVAPCLLAASSGSPPAPPPAALRRLARLVPLFQRLPPPWLASAIHTALVRGYDNRMLGAFSMDMYLKPFLSDSGRAAACSQLLALANTSAAVSLEGAQLTCPVSLMLGARDPFLPAKGEYVRRTLQAAVQQDFIVHRLAGVSHAIPEEAPDRLALAIAELLVH